MQTGRVLLVFAAGMASSLFGSTIVATATGLYTPSQTILYTEQITSTGGIPHVTNTNTGNCYLEAGCHMGDFRSLQFPQIIIPSGYEVTSAELDLEYGYGVLFSPQSVIVSPISTGSYLQATPGSAYRRVTVNVDSADGSLQHFFGLMDFPGASSSLDYTQAVNAALFSSSGILDPITGTLWFEYGSGDPLSVFGAVNSVTTYTTAISVPTGSFSGTLTIDTAPAPEPGYFGVLLLLGIVALIRGRRPACSIP